MNLTAEFERARQTMENLRQAVKAGDVEAQRLVAMADANHPGFVLADLRKWRANG